MTLDHYATAYPPAILLGGAENAVAAARALRRQGVDVVAVAEDRAAVHRSNGVRAERLGPRCDEPALEAWFRDRSPRWAGAALIPLSDGALSFVARSYEYLRARFALNPMDPAIVELLLDKQRTIELAQQVGVPVPRQWLVPDSSDLESILDEVTLPALVKPRDTHAFAHRTGRKFLWAHDRAELESSVATMRETATRFTMIEFIPGPDSNLCSYYALRQGGQILGEFTKRVERRFPENEGGGTLHQLVVDDDAKALGRKFFAAVGLEGLGNVEFKRDPRDSRLKLIECNTRLTAATELIERSGIELTAALYRQAIGAPEPFAHEAASRWYWYPFRDLRAARRLGARATLDWLSVPARRPCLPFWRADDPGPSLQELANQIRGFSARRRAG